MGFRILLALVSIKGNTVLSPQLGGRFRSRPPDWWCSADQ
jgi:hypothetical protein